MMGKTKTKKDEISPVFKAKQNTKQFTFFVFNVRSILKLKYPANWVFQIIQHNLGHNEPLRINRNDICIFLKIDMQWNIWISSQ